MVVEMRFAMKRKFILCLLICLLPVWASAQKYELVWKDSFRGRELDDTKWSRITRGRPDWRNYMSLNENLFELKRGKLHLKAMANEGIDPSDTAAFLTGGVYTKGKFTLTYGKVEVKAKIQSGKSVWPAIWMLPQEGAWPVGGEIDIMEHLNYDPCVYQTVHSHYTYNLKLKNDPRSYVYAPFDPDGYNVFGVEILPDRIIFQINGKTTLTYPRVESDEYPSKVQYPFGSPFYILMDMQIGGSWVGPADGRDLPVEMTIDWIKVYSLKL